MNFFSHLSLNPYHFPFYYISFYLCYMIHLFILYTFDSNEGISHCQLHAKEGFLSQAYFGCCWHFSPLSFPSSRDFFPPRYVRLTHKTPFRSLGLGPLFCSVNIIFLLIITTGYLSTHLMELPGVYSVSMSKTSSFSNPTPIRHFPDLD